MIGRVLFATSLAVGMSCHSFASRASGDNSLGALAAAKHCASCHAMPGEPDASLAASLEEISTTKRVWTDIDLRTALPHLHGAKAVIMLTSEEAFEVGRYLQNIQSGHPEFLPQ